MLPMELGSIGIWSSSLRNAPQGEVIEAAAELEQLGYSALWMPGGMPDGLAERIGAMLQATQDTIVASGIVSVWTHSVAKVAADFSSFEKTHPGRFLLGLGVSHAHVVQTAGLKYEHPLRQMNGFLDALDEAAPETMQRRIIAALGPRMLEVAGRRSLGTHPYFTTPEHTRRARQTLGDGAIVAPEQMVVLETDAAAARDIARGAMARYLAAPNYSNNLDRLGFGPADLANGGSDSLVDAIVAWGEPAKIMERIAEHHDAGADHVCVQVLTGGDPQALPRNQWRRLAGAFR